MILISLLIRYFFLRFSVHLSGLQKRRISSTILLYIIDLLIPYYNIWGNVGINLGIFISFIAFIASNSVGVGVLSYVFYKGSLAQRLKFIGRYALFVGIISTLIMLLFPLIGSRFFITFSMMGNSMEPTISEGELLLVYKTPKNIKRGDIIVFTALGRKTPSLQRVIGLPGETIIISNNIVSICDTNQQKCATLPESYLSSGMVTSTHYCKKNIFSLSTGYFTLGDQRTQSADGRCCYSLGCDDDSHYEIDADNILGKVIDTVPASITPWLQALYAAKNKFKKQEINSYDKYNHSDLLLNEIMSYGTGCLSSEKKQKIQSVYDKLKKASASEKEISNFITQIYTVTKTGCRLETK